MTAQPGTPGPDTGSYEVIHLGGHTAVVVPVAGGGRTVIEAPSARAEIEAGM